MDRLYREVDTRVATNTIREVKSPLDRLTPLMVKEAEPRHAAPA